jgi:lipopolysaccharide transport system ATP-binding protein
MSSNEVAISIRGLAKSYKIRHQEEHRITLAEELLHRAQHPLTRQKRETFWALRDISLDVYKGEVLGVIGHNGAGKSTLLKLLSRITPPTKGDVRLYR